MNVTPIEWADFTSNPIKFRNAAGAVVWGCVHASPGCQHCYAETLAKRYGKGGPFNVPTMAGLTPFLDEAELRRMLTAKRVSGRQVSGSRVFVGDMTDIFGEWVPAEMLDRMFAVFALRQDVTWQVLTKRSERMRDYINAEFRANKVFEQMTALTPDRGVWVWPTWREAMRNVWLGVSVEDQQRADERIPHLLDTPAAVRFISAEPLLGQLDLTTGGDVTEVGHINWLKGFKGSEPDIPGLDWVIVGGESGPGARDCGVAWIRSIVSQCQSASVSVFVKQLGSRPRLAGPCESAIGERWIVTAPSGGTAIVLKSKKGGDPLEWPPSFRVREFPAVAA